MLLIAYGTRPEYLKIKPLLKQLKSENVEYKLLKISQHTDLIENFEWDINIPIVDKTDNRLNDIVSSILEQIGLLEEVVTHVMVQGDTTSALAMALYAFHEQIPVIHLEAGLRTYNVSHPYPEELNRQLITRIVSLHLCPTEQAKQNLLREQIDNNTIHVVGNTSIDNIKNIRPIDGNIVLITLHRRENRKLLMDWFKEINALAQKNLELKFIVISHPSIFQEIYTIFTQNNIKVIDPVSHDDCIKLLTKSCMVITDSGGLQEEAAFLRKKCIVCRKQTERCEGLNVFSWVCCRYGLLSTIFKYVKRTTISLDVKCPYGNGNTSEKIINIMKSIL